jgi:hypothetical protein
MRCNLELLWAIDLDIVQHSVKGTMDRKKIQKYITNSVFLRIPMVRHLWVICIPDIILDAVKVCLYFPETLMDVAIHLPQTTSLMLLTDLYSHYMIGIDQGINLIREI